MSTEEAGSTSVSSSTELEQESKKHFSVTTNGSNPTAQSRFNSLPHVPTQGATTLTPKTTNQADGSTPESTHSSKSENARELLQSPSEAPPALVSTSSKKTEEGKNDKEIHGNVSAESANVETPMEVDNDEEMNVSHHSDREDSPGLVIAVSSDLSEEEAPPISQNHVQESKDDDEMSGEEIDLNVPLEESSDEETESHPRKDHTPHLRHTSQNSSPQTNGVEPSPIVNSIKSHDQPDSERSMSPSYRAKQVAKLKRFFTTLQGFGNKLGSEGAEQVQELILALVNKTATIEEFHQEIQTVTNHPLKQFIIPFLQENLDYLRQELKESSKTLSDILNQDGEAPAQNSFTLTPQPADDELPVYKTPQSTGPPKPSVGVISSRKIQPPTISTTSATPTSEWRNGQRTTRVTSQVVSGGVLMVASNTQSNKVYGTGMGVVSRSNVRVLSNSPTISGTRMSPAVADDQTGLIRQAGAARKRDRDSINDRVSLGSLGSEKDTQTVTNTKYYSKRPRTDPTFSDDIVITSSTRHIAHPPPYPQPPLTYPILSTTPTTSEAPPPPPRHSGALLEDWQHLDMMLTSMHGMMERTRHAVALLKDRITVTQTELERRELDQEAMIQARVVESVEKIKQRAEEEKQALIAENNKRIRDAVGVVRTEMEARLTSSSSAAVQDALKDAHKQSNSKENCWNCGRRATETCSGCSKARYCGTFCQHKDWSNHMHHCASGLQVQQDGVYERRRPSGDVALIPSGRGKTVTRAIPVPVSLVQGGEVNMRHITPRPLPHSHADIGSVMVKTEKT